MARLTDQQWELAKSDYEVKGLSFRQVAESYGVNASTIKRKADKDSWVQGKTQHLVDKKINAFKELHETQQQMQHLNATQQAVIDGQVFSRLQQEQLFVNAAVANQAMADAMLQNADRLQDLESHARLTKTNKETVLGKDPQTQVNVNQEAPKRVEYVIVDGK